MNALLHQAQKLLETAATSAEAGLCGGDWTIFYGPEGGLQMIAGSEHRLDSLAYSHGAVSAWQISRHGGRVRVDGCSGGSSCRLETQAPDGAVRRLLNNSCLYQLAGGLPI